mmetsp:Transcript_3686/g.4695  ORF Transcript_3686/g.4695 Transcript_3686/m.4695 type:complete len:465 (-) Transcript_3686:448-1842(-)
MKFTVAPSLLALVCALPQFSEAFTPSSISSTSWRIPFSAVTPLQSTTKHKEAAPESDAAFSAFAESLDEDSLFDDENDNSGFDEQTTWQESLESLLDPTTPLAKRQILLSDLLNANENIQKSVQEALTERKIDPLLTPTGKKLQDGTRAVARQITTDILPGIAAAAGGTSAREKITEELPTLVPKIGSRIFSTLTKQTQKNLEQLRGDIANPSRIPERITKQTADLATEAKNVFLETPEGLAGPKYKVVGKGQGYELREYDGYTVASTSMSMVGEPYSMDDITSGGAAFNALAAYLFGANDEGKSMEMTTPVSTTSAGEMRFCLKNDGVTTDNPYPNPLTEEDDSFNEKGAVKIVEVPQARLAVARFTGFVTEGEVARQKDALLSSLAADGVEIDVPHGAVVPHVVFQYSPPYTIPIVRRNEVAVPVVAPDDKAALEKEWGEAEDEASKHGLADDLAPSDVSDD